MKVLILVAVFVSFVATFHSVEACEDGWTDFNDQCYRFFESEGLTWLKSEEACEADGGHLTSINSQEEQDFVYNLWVSSRGDNPIGLISSKNIPAMYIGLFDVDSSGDFQWIDGSALDYTNWTPNQPSYGHQDAIVMWDWPTSKGGWNDISATTTLGSFVCEAGEVNQSNKFWDGVFTAIW